MANGTRISFINTQYNKPSNGAFFTRNHTAIIVDSACDNADELLIGDSDQFINPLKHWLILGSNHTFNVLKNVDLTINADITVAVNMNNITWNIFDVYNPYSKRNGELKIKKIGFYDEKNKLKIKTAESKYKERRNLTGIEFKSFIVLTQDFEETFEKYLESDRNRHINTFDRFNYRVLQHCRDFYNYRYVMYGM